MEEKIKLMLYPFRLENHFLVQTNPNYEIVGVFCHDNRYNYKTLSEKGIKVVHDYYIERWIELCDGIIFYPADNINDTYRAILLENIGYVLRNKKRVYCMFPISNKEKQLFADIPDVKNNLCFLYEKEDRFDIDDSKMILQICECDIPIIFVGQICEGVYSKDLTVGITNSLLKRNYRVHTILDDSCGQLMGMSITPSFLRSMMKEEEKIVKLNEYIRDKQRKYQPDVMVIQVPGVVNQFSKKSYSDFGIYHFYYSKAYCPDIYFLTTPLNMASNEMIDHLDELMKIQYGYEVDGVWQTDYLVDVRAVIENGEIDGQVLCQEKVHSYETKHDKVICASYEEQFALYNKFADIVENLLSSDIEIF